MSAGRPSMRCGFLFALAFAVAATTAAQTADVLSLGRDVVFRNRPASVPVYLRDVSGTRLDAGTAAQIRVIQFTVNYTHPEYVSGCSATPAPKCSVHFEPDGVLADASPLISTVFLGYGTAVVRYVYSPSTPLDFKLDAPPPGDLIGHLIFQIGPDAVLETEMTLTIDPAAPTELANELDGNVVETVGNGLAIQAGSIAVTSCTGLPATFDVQWSGERGCSLTGECALNELLTFEPYILGYVIRACDVFTWTFDDGEIVAGRTVTHAFRTAGAHTAKLTITNLSGTKSVTKTVPVSGVPQTVQCTPCTAAVTDRAVVNEAVSFAAGILSTCDLTSVSWTFGDGTSAFGRDATKSYQQTGSYTWTLLIRSTSGEVCSRSGRIVIAPPCTGACIAAVPEIGYVNVPLPFYATGIDCPSSSILWTFGDGTVATRGGAQMHTYTTPGTYSWHVVSLNQGVPDCVVTGTIVIGAGPHPGRRRSAGRSD
jgi:PKD repeat protein